MYSPRPDHPATGDFLAPIYAWVRPSGITVTRHQGFTYHHTPDELAQIGLNLIQEAGDPQGLNDILGAGLDLGTVMTPRGPIHFVGENGNHRAAILRSAGFPVALAQISRCRPPWAIRTGGAGSAPLLRLLYRYGLLTDYEPGGPTAACRDTFDADGVTSWLLDFETPEKARENLLALEAMLGQQLDPRLGWIRDARTFQRLLRGTLAVTECGLDVLPRIAGTGPRARPFSSESSTTCLLARARPQPIAQLSADYEEVLQADRASAPLRNLDLHQHLRYQPAPRHITVSAAFPSPARSVALAITPQRYRRAA